MGQAAACPLGATTDANCISLRKSHCQTNLPLRVLTPLHLVTFTVQWSAAAPGAAPRPAARASSAAPDTIAAYRRGSAAPAARASSGLASNAKVCVPALLLNLWAHQNPLMHTGAHDATPSPAILLQSWQTLNHHQPPNPCSPRPRPHCSPRQS